MQVNSINGVSTNSVVTRVQNPSFGHTFRVSICTKDSDGVYSYVSPAKNVKLYKKLNKKVVGFLNEDFITNLREAIGIPRKVVKSKTPNEVTLQQNIVQKLSEIDSDYNQARFVRSSYSKGSLGYIATGADAPIIEEFMGADGVGVAKSVARKNKLRIEDSGVREIVSKFQKDSHEYVKSPSQILRTKDNHEIMLRVNFNELKGKRGGKSRYEMADFDFVEVKSKPLVPLTATDKSLKKDINLDWVVIRYIKHSFDKIYEKNKLKLSPQKIIDVRDKFTNYISKKMHITHDLPIE